MDNLSKEIGRERKTQFNPRARIRGRGLEKASCLLLWQCCRSDAAMAVLPVVLPVVVLLRWCCRGGAAALVLHVVVLPMVVLPVVVLPRW